MRKKDDTKRLLLDAAKQILGSEGSDAISMRELGKKVQLSRGALYRHFKNKDELLAFIAAEDFIKLNSDMAGILEINADPITILETLFVKYYEFGVSNREHYRLMFGREWDKALYPGLYDAASSAFKTVTLFIKKALDQKGLIQERPEELTAIAYAFIHGLVELNFAGHREPEKGLDEPLSLIKSFICMCMAKIRCVGESNG